jgi:hypothetical protein
LSAAKGTLFLLLALLLKECIGVEGIIFEYSPMKVDIVIVFIFSNLAPPYASPEHQKYSSSTA